MLNNFELRGNTDSERCFLLNLIQCYTVYRVMCSMQHGPQKIVLFSKKYTCTFNFVYKTMPKYACFAHVAQCQPVIGWSQPGNVQVNLELYNSSLFTLGGDFKDNKVIVGN